MILRKSLAPLVLAVGLGSSWVQPGATAAAPRVAVVIGSAASDLERYAAEQLCGYLDRLYGVKTGPTTSWPSSAEIGFLVGSPASNPLVGRALGDAGWPKVSDQAIVLKRARLDGKRALVIGGGSPRATLWAVYELVERWGVRYLVHGDILPERPPEFRLPDEDLVLEPKLRIRQWRVINDFAMGPESWGMGDYRPVLDQLAKLRFNRIFVSIWPYQPFLHFEARGVKRSWATLWYDYHYPITDDMPGRSLFGRVPEFWNPDLPRGASYEAFSAAGQRLVHQLMEHAHRRGMDCVITAALTEFPPEFAPLLTNPQKVHQLGEMTVVPGPETRLTDPALTDLAAAVLRATVNTYPEADIVALGMPEFRQWGGQYEQAWASLDRKHGLAKVRKLADVVAAAKRRLDYPGGAERALQEVKGDIVALEFYDRLLTEIGVLKQSRRPDMKFSFDSVAEELFPVLPRIVPPGSETMNFVDYTPSRVVRRRGVLAQLPSRELPAVLIYTLHDDNVGVLPQLATGSLHELTLELRRHGWAGFSTRYWLTGDHDPCLAYLSKAAWDDRATPALVYRDQLRAACGEAAVPEMLTVLAEVEAATIDLEWHGLGLTFPVPGMIMKEWTPSLMPPELLKVRERYQKALDAARRAMDKAPANRRDYAAYWVGRLEFGVGYLDAVALVRQAAMAEKQNDPRGAALHAQNALAAVRTAIESYARVARDQSDRGAIATMAEYVYRPLKAKSRS